MPRNIKWGSELPICDFCDEPARYDGKTIHGPWANMCPIHLAVHGYPNIDGITNYRVMSTDS